MKKSRHTLTALLLVLALLIGSGSALASPLIEHPEQPPLEPLAPFTGLLMCSVGINISNAGKVTCSGFAQAYSNYTVQITLELQERVGNSWNTIANWSSSKAWSVELVKYYYVTSGTYRTLLTVKAYDSSGKLVDNHSSTSLACTY